MLYEELRDGRNIIIESSQLDQTETQSAVVQTTFGNNPNGISAQEWIIQEKTRREEKVNKQRMSSEKQSDVPQVI